MNENKFFPSTKAEALAMLYLQNQNLSGKSPEEIAELYQDAYQKIRNYDKETSSKSGKPKTQRIYY